MLAANIIVDDGSPNGEEKWITNTLECVAGGGTDYRFGNTSLSISVPSIYLPIAESPEIV